MQIQVKSVCSRISTSKESVIQQINVVKILTNYKKPRQSIVRIQLIKSYWKSRMASNSSCIFLERDPCLRLATKFVATEIRQVKQMVTQSRGPLKFYLPWRFFTVLTHVSVICNVSPLHTLTSCFVRIDVSVILPPVHRSDCKLCMCSMSLPVMLHAFDTFTVVTFGEPKILTLLVCSFLHPPVTSFLS